MVKRAQDFRHILFGIAFSPSTKSPSGGIEWEVVFGNFPNRHRCLAFWLHAISTFASPVFCLHDVCRAGVSDGTGECVAAEFFVAFRKCGTDGGAVQGAFPDVVLDSRDYDSRVSIVADGADDVSAFPIAM